MPEGSHGRASQSAEVADWLVAMYPAECQEKKERSSFIKTDAQLVQQL